MEQLLTESVYGSQVGHGHDGTSFLLRISFSCHLPVWDNKVSVPSGQQHPTETLTKYTHCFIPLKHTEPSHSPSHNFSWWGMLKLFLTILCLCWKTKWSAFIIFIVPIYIRIHIFIFVSWAIKFIDKKLNSRGLIRLQLFLKPVNFVWPSHLTDASDSHCQKNSPQARRNRYDGAVKGLVVDIGDDMQRSAVGLFTGRLDLILRELKGESPIVSQLKGVSEWDAFKTSPVSGWARVGVYRNNKQAVVTQYVR